MEPDVVPLPSSSSTSSSSPPHPPPPGDDGDEELGSEDDEFGDFGGFSCPDPPPASLKPASHQTSCSSNQAVEQSQPTSTVNLESDRRPSLRLTNGFAGRLHGSGAAVGASSPREETGFADFSVFSDQAAHPWCCGFSPGGGGESWDGRAGRTNLLPAGRKVVTESEPQPGKDVKHCEDRDARPQPSQDQHQPQDAAADPGFPSAEEEPRFGLRSLLVSEAEGGDKGPDGSGVSGVSGVLQRLDMFGSEDLPSFSDDLSFEGVSADLEPNVSSLDQTDWDRTDDEEEELELSDSFISSRAGRSEDGSHHRDQHATQETRSTSNRPGAEPEDGSADRGPDLQGDQEGVQILGNLPPSDSFADFCSAPTQDDGQTWAEFRDQEGRSGPQIREPVDEEDQDQEGQEGHGDSRRSSCQDSLSCRVQQLLQTSFPEVEVLPAGGEEELLDLHALLQNQHPSEEEPAGLRAAQWLQDMLSPHRDVHRAVGLQFQWGGSHSNRILLSCLGVDTRNIVFIGSRKQPLTVPAFASGLGMLEPTKDFVGSSGLSVVSAAAPELLDGPDPSTRPLQEELPSSRPDWSRRGLSSSQDGSSPRRAPHFWGRK